MEASTFYDIANVDYHPEFDPLTSRDLRIPPDHCALDLDGTTQRVNGTDAQHQQAIANRPYDPATMLFDFGRDELSMMGVQLSKSAFVIDTYQAAVSGNIRHQDCHESTFDFLTGHS